MAEVSVVQEVGGVIAACWLPNDNTRSSEDYYWLHWCWNRL